MILVENSLTDYNMMSKIIFSDTDVSQHFISYNFLKDIIRKATFKFEL
jgi:hypothetical protein